MTQYPHRQRPQQERPATHGALMQVTALTATRATRIPRRQSLAPPFEIEKLLVDRSSIFPAHYHAVGECIAHPQRPCKCIKTRRMAQSQADAWQELGRRFKERCPLPADLRSGRSHPARRSSCFEVRDRTVVPDRPALARRSSMPQERCPIGSPVAAACGRMRRNASTGTPGAAFVCCGTAVCWMAAPGRRAPWKP